MDMSEERFVDLETRIAHQDQLLHELNEVVTGQRDEYLKRIGIVEIS